MVASRERPAPKVAESLPAEPPPELAAAPDLFIELPIPTSNSDPFGITAGPDGNVWFTENLGNKIGEVRLPR